MQYQTAMPYTSTTAPKVGVVYNSIGAFSAKGKAIAETKWTALFRELQATGVIHADSLLLPRIFGPHEAMDAADQFARKMVDVVIIVNSAFPNGLVFPTIALHPQLRHTPLIITAEDEPDLGDREWTTNAWCGVIMNNYLAKRIQRPFRALPGDPNSAEYQQELKMLLNSYRAIAIMRREFLGRFGDAPGGFHSATMDQFLYLQTFGVRQENIDLLALVETFRTGKATGLCGETSFSDDEVTSTMQEMKSNRPCLISEEHLRKGARFYHALKAHVEANGFTSIAVKCWPELYMPGLEVAACFPMTWLLSKGIVRAASCESDGPTAVIQSMATLLSGKPAACLDFVSYTGRCSILELGHCGVGIAGHMGDGEAIAYKSPDRQGGDPPHAPALIGQFAYGVKTGLAITQTPAGELKMLTFSGTSSPETAKGKLYSAADIRYPEYQQLDRLILQHGFPHHLAVALDDISAEIAEVCAFLGIGYYNPALL